MEKIQVSAAALSVLLAAGLASSFRLPNKYRNISPTAWFTHNGIFQSAFDYNTTSNYTYFGTSELTCFGTGKLCAIQIIVTNVFEDDIQTGTSGSFGAPLGTNIENNLNIRITHCVDGPNSTVVLVENKN